VTIKSEVGPGRFGPARDSRAVDATPPKIKRNGTAWQAKAVFSIETESC